MGPSMGKRSDFARFPRDLYPTPREPVQYLLPHLAAGTRFAEPCCGDGDLVDHLAEGGHICTFAGDIEPGVATWSYAETRDGLALDSLDLAECECIITNPPWPKPRTAGEPTLALIRHFSAIRPTWLLLAADFAHNVYAGEVLDYCQKIVSVGRVVWIPGTDQTGKDNVAWYLFDQSGARGRTVFVGRLPKGSLDRDTQLLIG